MERVRPRPSGFQDPSRFDFTAGLEQVWEAIRDEYLALPADAFEPWVQTEMYGAGWGVYGLVVQGQPLPSTSRQCPRTAAALQAVPGLTLGGFSRLAPGAHIKPHVGWVKSVYRLHLGLVVPPGCRLRVGGETRPWTAGRCLIFDDTVEHEAWNESSQARAVLLLDFLRPGVPASAIDQMPDEVQALARRLLARG
jgi:beta-hydroxylase